MSRDLSGVEYMSFCVNCGSKIKEGASFCTKCGFPVLIINNDNQSQRECVYEGDLHKCPSCGELLNSFVTICPTCGYELRNSKTTNYILDFSNKLESAESFEEKDSLIRHFVMPNTKEDIYEFIILAATNIEAGGENIDAWLVKLEQAYHKAKIILGSSDEFSIIENIYRKAVVDYKIERRKNKASSVGVFLMNHWKGALLLVLGLLSLSLVFMGSVFEIGPIWTWYSTKTTGHLWWKNTTAIPHSWHVLTVIGIFLSIFTILLAIILSAVQSSRKNNHQTPTPPLNENEGN